MSRSSWLNFADQDLRNRSFRGQNLCGANFEGADLRGCDFSRALLRSANFDRAILGSSRRQICLLLGIMLAVAAVTIDAISHMLFGVLGRTSAESGWSFVLALAISLAIAASSSLPRVAQRLTLPLSGTASAALLSFYYGGKSASNNSQIAIASAILGGAIALLLWQALKTKRRFLAPLIFATSAIAAYALACWLATWAIASLTTQNFALGLICTALTAVYFAIVLFGLTRTTKSLRTVGTSFRGADLTAATFTQTCLQADFSGAIGSPALSRLGDDQQARA